MPRPQVNAYSVTLKTPEGEQKIEVAGATPNVLSSMCWQASGSRTEVVVVLHFGQGMDRGLVGLRKEIVDILLVVLY
jgi:hypothetical protein